jgi:hypothetical protein
MRLINTETLEMREFFDSQIPEHYAILSHAWDDEEISIQEWRIVEEHKKSIEERTILFTSDSWIKKIKEKAGYRKVIDFCTLCQQPLYGFAWAWIDTCCV